MHVHSPIFPGKLIENNLDRNLQFTKNSSTYLNLNFTVIVSKMRVLGQSGRNMTVHVCHNQVRFII